MAVGPLQYFELYMYVSARPHQICADADGNVHVLHTMCSTYIIQTCFEPPSLPNIHRPTFRPNLLGVHTGGPETLA